MTGKRTLDQYVLPQVSFMMKSHAGADESELHRCIEIDRESSTSVGGTPRVTDDFFLQTTASWEFKYNSRCSRLSSAIPSGQEKPLRKQR